MNGEKGRGKEQTQEEGMGHDGKKRWQEARRTATASVPSNPSEFRACVPGHVDLLFALMLFPLFLLLALPAIVLAAKDSPHQQLVKLAANNNGVVKLDAKTFDLIISPQRDWSASIHFTALDKRRKCAPCRSVTTVCFS